RLDASGVRTAFKPLATLLTSGLLAFLAALPGPAAAEELIDNAAVTEVLGKPDGLIAHIESEYNGRNNALRINGLGAPRAFDTAVLRQMGLPNTSYGEDYAVALRISRQFEIGRIYDCLYFARRWSGNSDSALPLQTANRYDAYKDRLRTIEILARQKFNAEKHNQ
ncbi:MAG: hypothetical protein ACKVZH_06015, partial [Blastocatellia bacterium]